MSRESFDPAISGTAAAQAAPTNGVRKQMTPEQQLEAVRRAQSRVEQRVKLGVQLFRSAEAQLTQQQDLLADAKQEQADLRAQLEADVTRSLRAYDQWLGRMDDRMTSALESLEQRLERLHTQWQETERRLEQMAERAERLLTQSRDLLEANPPTARAPYPQHHGYTHPRPIVRT